MADKHARVSWKGDLENGSGTIEQVGSGAFGPLAVSWAARTGDEGGMTSPEELMAAAHAACFAMAMNAALGKKGGKAAKTHVTATVAADKSDAGIKIVSSKLKVVVEGLEGMTPADFAAFVKEADKGCPVSNAYRGTMAIEVEGSVK